MYTPYENLTRVRGLPHSCINHRKTHTVSIVFLIGFHCITTSYAMEKLFTLIVVLTAALCGL